MLLGACQMVDDCYKLETDNESARIKEMLAAVQPATLALHDLCESEDESLAETRKGSQLGPPPEDARAARGNLRGRSPGGSSCCWRSSRNEDPT